jgi:type II secretory pathway pseudopilin PulG
MFHSPSLTYRRVTAGFTLPAILVVVGALLILAVASLLVVGIDRNTARSYTDRQRAELAAKAGLDAFRSILKKQTAKDDFVIVQATEENPAVTNKEYTPYLYLARGSATGGAVEYNFQPLFSTETIPNSNQILAPPRPESLVGTAAKSFSTHPWLDEAKVSWITIKDPKSKIVSRYAYWVEDLQGKIDGRVAGNTERPSRSSYPQPSGLAVNPELPPLSGMEIGAIDPAATDQSLESERSLAKTIVEARPAMLSPDSIIGATNILKSTPGGDSDKPALVRDAETGLLENPIAAAIEKEVSPVLQPYKEQALIPHSFGIRTSFMGRPKLNLNRLLKMPRSGAVDEIARRISDCFPDFENSRKGGFPDNYLQTLAAGMMDYADSDNEPTISPGSYVGIDAYPHISETVLIINFLGSSRVAGREVQRWNFRLFIELWNMTNQPVNGSASFSYEVDLRPVALGSGASSSTLPFDSPLILNDRNLSTHDLRNRSGKFFTVGQGVSLLPDQYRFYEVANVNYTLPDASGGMEFDLEEPQFASGMTMEWNGQPVHVIAKFNRDPWGVSDFINSNPRTADKASIPGHTYGVHDVYINNMGDPRISHYLRNEPVNENAYPVNASPGRRNVRRGGLGPTTNTYDKDSAEKPKFYARVLPSEWPDGGHNSPIDAFPVRTDSRVIPTDTSLATGWPSPPVPVKENAPQRISNLGLFYSATELGNIYDPIMWLPVYPNSSKFNGRGGTSAIKSGLMPSGGSMPDVSNGSSPSLDHGGGNTLRIGRPEHERFDREGLRASQLLDIFHAGIPHSEISAEREGDLIEINGNVNVNTAGRTALRVLATGMLTQDPELRRVTSWAHDTNTARPQTSPIELGAPTIRLLADQIADAIILRRPFNSAAELASIRDLNDNPVFGNPDLYQDVTDIQWSDAAAEENFSRVYDAATVRSRNFRIWVIGQAITGPEADPVVLSESRKSFTVFADPGVRNSDGTIDPVKYRPRVTYENDF